MFVGCARAGLKDIDGNMAASISPRGGGIEAVFENAAIDGRRMPVAIDLPRGPQFELFQAARFTSDATAISLSSA
jgi:hypothetical protein